MPRTEGAKNKLPITYTRAAEIAIVTGELQKGRPINAICREFGFNAKTVYKLISMGLIPYEYKEPAKVKKNE